MESESRQKKNRKILHIDLDAFFCACEELENPSLRGTVFAVGGQAESRGVISSCSYSARALGIHSAMPTSQALRICPTLRLIHSGMGRYRERSESVMDILRDVTPLMEQVSVDEAFLDVSDMSPSLEGLALTIQNEIREKTGLPCSLGGASNKLVAKVANTVGKKRVRTNTYPCSINCIAPGHEAEFLAPLPVGRLWGIGKQSESKLRSLGITTIGYLALYPEDAMKRLFGKNAFEIHEHANGRDDSPVNPDPEQMKSVSQETTFAQDVDDENILRQTILHQAVQVGFRLRKKELRGNTVRIKLRWSDFSTITRQSKLDYAINQDSLINQYAQALFDEAWLPTCRPVRLIGVGVTGLDAETVQLSFLEPEHEREDRLLRAVDEIQKRYGKASIRRAFDLPKE